MDRIVISHEKGPRLFLERALKLTNNGSKGFLAEGIEHEDKRGVGAEAVVRRILMHDIDAPAIARRTSKELSNIASCNVDQLAVKLNAYHASKSMIRGE